MSYTSLPAELIRSNRVAETVLRIRPIGIAICPASMRLRRLHEFDGLRFQHTTARRSAVRSF